MSNIICDKEGYALSLGDRVRVQPTVFQKSAGFQMKTVEPLIGTVSGFNPLATYSIRVTQRDGSFDWYRASEIRKLAARTLRIAEIKPVPFRRA